MPGFGHGTNEMTFFSNQSSDFDVANSFGTVGLLRVSIGLPIRVSVAG